MAPVLGGPVCVRVVLNSTSSAHIVIVAPVLGGQEGVRARGVLNSSSSVVCWPRLRLAAPVLGGPEVVRVVLNS